MDTVLQGPLDHEITVSTQLKSLPPSPLLVKRGSRSTERVMESPPGLHLSA